MASLVMEEGERSRLDALDPFAVAVALVESGRVLDSGPYWRKALSAAPRDGQRWYAWGATLGQVGRYVEAERALWGAVALGYDPSPVWEALGVVYVRLRKLTEAEQAYQEAVTRDPSNAASWLALGNARFATGDRAKGRICYEKAVGLVGRQGTSDAANVAQARLWLGQWRLGFRAYEQRRMMSEWRAAMREATQMPGGPLGVRHGEWLKRGENGYEPLDTRPLIVMAEQGQGDAIQFARFLPLVAEKTGCPVWFRSHTALVPLMAGAFKDDPRIRVLDKGDTLGPADVQGWVPLMSLPYFLGISAPGQLPPPIRPYGVGWAGGGDGIYVHEQGNTAHAYDWDRSAPKGTLVEMVEKLGHTVVRYEDGDDWQATVDKMCACGRVVTVDTAVAHLAGSLGIPVDIFVPCLPEWRWGARQSRTSPWYPSATLFWRDRSDGWEAVTTRWVEERT